MKRFYLFILLSVMLLPAYVNAQQTDTVQFTLDQCIKYALENSINVKNAILDEDIAKAKVKETVGIGLPQVNGSGNIMYNQKLQRYFTAYNPNGGIIDLGSNTGLKTGDVIAAPNFFQLKSSASIAVGVKQIIFDGSYLVGLKASKAYKELAYKATDQTKEQTIQQVTKAYYIVLINKERANLLTNNIARLDSLLKNTQARFKNGFAESIDVDRIRVQLNNRLTERDNLLNSNELAFELLKFQMNFPMSQTLTVVGNISDVEVKVDTESLKGGWDYKIRPDYKVLEAQRKLQELNIKNVQAGSMPSLSAFANFGYNTQSSDIAGLFKTNTDISKTSDRVKSVYGADKWYDYSNYGLSLNVPLFSGFQQRHRIQQEKLSLLKLSNSFKALESSIDLEIKQASIGFDNANKTLASQKENMDLASNIARITKIKYEQGVGSNIEVIDAESSLKESQINYYNALYDAIIAKVDLDKAYGKLLPPPVENK